VPSATAALEGEGATLLGGDERTAAIHEGGRWRAVGLGRVHVLGRVERLSRLPPPR
jgi:hypothetical protein